MTEFNYYTLHDIEKILFDGIQYVLQVDTLEIIKKLEKDLKIIDDPENPPKKTHDKMFDRGHNNDRRNMNTKKVDNRYGKHSNSNLKELTNNDWETVRSFKTTKIEVKKGIEKNINEIRILLNKISNKNYDTQKTLIKDSIVEFLKLNEELGQELKEDEDKEEDINKLVKSIFDIISTNKFFSELYAKLYKELMESFGFFHDILHKNIDKYKESIQYIVFVDPNKDYDGFCANTKQNDNRKAMAQFILNMYKNNVLEVDVILDILTFLLQKSTEYIDIENRINEVEEITENIYILVANSPTLLVNDNWKTNILPVIISISQKKIKDHKSLSNRIIFKYMDIIDSIE